MQDDSLQEKEMDTVCKMTICEKVRNNLQEHEMQFVNLYDMWNIYNLQEYEVQFVKLHEKRKRD